MKALDAGMWLVAAVSLVGTIANLYKRPWGFALWIVTDVAWVGYDIYVGALHQAALLTIYGALAAWGLVRWLKEV
jgi:nicotinamide riboside transporter PnuC